MTFIAELDRALLHWFVAHRLPGFDGPVAFYSELTRPAWLLVLAVLLAGVVRVRTGSWRWGYLPAAILAANLGNRLLKELIGRERPGAEFQLVAEVSSALPSGHAMGAAACATAVTVLLGGRRRGVVATVWVLAVLTALSRLYLGVHWGSDVLVGAGLGVGGSLLLAAALRAGIDFGGGRVNRG